jgi:serine/threonine protein kinase
VSLNRSTKVGPYEILEPIGAGGMGEVYKARDTRLDRIVAIKISAARFSERFEREAHAVAALNHPHICTLYDVGPDYLVMEYLEGVPVKGPIPLDQALKLAAQIADALDSAHRKGITHRDLKPANILLTKAGARLLDFGLAKMSRDKPASDETVTRALTQEGAIVGTPQYMAPEQLQGKDADSRSDIFSFGCVVYELLTGRRAFDGEDPASIIAAIMKEEPAPVTALARVTPKALDRLVRKCLSKDPDERWQSARDLRDELLWISSGSDETVVIAAAGKKTELVGLDSVPGRPGRGRHSRFPSTASARGAAARHPFPYAGAGKRVICHLSGWREGLVSELGRSRSCQPEHHDGRLQPQLTGRPEGRIEGVAPALADVISEERRRKTVQNLGKLPVNG